MHVNTRKLAVSGLLMAFDVVLIILSGIIDFNTLFLLAAAAFLVGVIIREFDLKYGLAFFVGSLVLGVLLAPEAHAVTGNRTGKTSGVEKQKNTSYSGKAAPF